MRRIILLLFLIAAVWIGIKIAEDSGYLLIAYGHWTIEMPLWLGIVLMAFIFLGLYLLFRLFHHVTRTSQYWQFWSKKWRKQRAIKKTSQGFLDIINGHFKTGEKRLFRAASDSPFALVNYLTAAKAAFFQKAYARSESYLNKALEQNPDASIAVGITKAGLEVENQNWNAALAILKPLEIEAPRNPNILMLLKIVYQQLHAWRDLVELFPRLRKSALENADSLKKIEYQAYCGLLESPEEDIHQIWHRIPRHFRQNPQLIYFYAKRLNQINEPIEAETILKKYLKHEWNEDMVVLYGEIVTSHTSEQLRFVERFLKQYPDSAHLFLCLGKLAMRAKLWGKAKHYLEMSIKQKPSVEGYQMLGKILEVLGDKEGAFVMYRKSTQ